MKCIVTGGSGFLGSMLQMSLQRKFKVTLYDLKIA